MIYFYFSHNEIVWGCKVTHNAPARKYLKAGNYLWNAGIFVWNIETITDCIAKYKPNIAEDMDKIAEAIAMVIKEQENGVAGARAIVQTLTDKYPLI